MHDFCFTIPYGFAVLAGGLLGYLRRGSTASLAGGAGVGGLLLLAGFVSLKAFEKRRNSYLALALETRTTRILSLSAIPTAHFLLSHIIVKITLPFFCCCSLVSEILDL
jgi:uncharacterized membrane protein (UPF0136 family)